MIDALIDRNSKLEEENDRLNSEIRVLQGKITDSSPASQYSESTDECGRRAAVSFENTSN